MRRGGDAFLPAGVQLLKARSAGTELLADWQVLDILRKSAILATNLAIFPGRLPRCPSLVRLHSKFKTRTAA